VRTKQLILTISLTEDSAGGFKKFRFKCSRVGRKLLEVFKAEPCRKEKKRSTAFLRLLFIDVAAKHFLRHPPP
jgi:hypothetical protein